MSPTKAYMLIILKKMLKLILKLIFVNKKYIAVQTKGMDR